LIHPGLAAAQRVSERIRERNLTARFRPAANTRQFRYDALAEQDVGFYLSGYRAMFGVDTRTPPADLRLVEFCLALPEDQNSWNGERRRLVRRALADRVPASVLTNRRMGLQGADWYERLRGARHQIADALVRLERSDLARRALDLPRMRRLLERMPAEPQDSQETREYRDAFQRGLMVGTFLLWFEGKH
jgi:asparagine synthase (glutamine-hydrolysing)